MEPSMHDLKEVLRIFTDSEMKQMHLDLGGVVLSASKEGLLQAPAAQPPAAPPASQPAGSEEQTWAAPAPAAEPSGEVQPGPEPDDGTAVAVKAPSLGVFYRRPSPDQPPFVEVGDTVAAGDPVCVIDVMKLFTRVEAPCAGRVVQVCVEDGAMVEQGQALMRIDPQ